jgi:hypothetical protein
MANHRTGSAHPTCTLCWMNGSPREQPPCSQPQKQRKNYARNGTTQVCVAGRLAYKTRDVQSAGLLLHIKAYQGQHSTQITHSNYAILISNPLKHHHDLHTIHAHYPQARLIARRIQGPLREQACTPHHESSQRRSPSQPYTLLSEA